MSAFRPAPPFAHDRPSRIGVLLVNLGTPDAPTRRRCAAIWREFLSDRRVVEIPRRGLAADPARRHPARAAGEIGDASTRRSGPRTARRCSSTACRQRSLLLGYLGERLKAMGLPSDFAPVELAMRYGNPAVAGAMDRLRGGRLRPHPGRAAVSAVRGEHHGLGDGRRVRRTRSGMRRMPALRAIDCFHDDPGYIKALAHSDQRRLDEARPAGPAGAELPRPAAALARPGRPLPLPMPQDGAAAGGGAGPRRRRSTPSPSSRASARPSG